MVVRVLQVLFVDVRVLVGFPVVVMLVLMLDVLVVVEYVRMLMGHVSVLMLVAVWLDSRHRRSLFFRWMTAILPAVPPNCYKRKSWSPFAIAHWWPETSAGGIEKFWPGGGRGTLFWWH